MGVPTPMLSIPVLLWLSIPFETVVKYISPVKPVTARTCVPPLLCRNLHRHINQHLNRHLNRHPHLRHPSLLPIIRLLNQNPNEHLNQQDKMWAFKTQVKPWKQVGNPAPSWTLVKPWKQVGDPAPSCKRWREWIWIAGKLLKVRNEK